MVAKCTCSNEYQDQRYGQGKRLFNPCKPKMSHKGFHYYRCTVCKREMTHND